MNPHYTRGSNLVSVNSRYSVTEAMKEPIGYKACWICLSRDEAIVFVRNIKAVATRLNRSTTCFRYRVPKYDESAESMRIQLQLISNGQMKAEDIASEWMVVMEITA